MAERRALITGLTGQDGSYLADLLLEKGYHVFGIIRRLSSPNMANIEHLRDRVEILDADLMDQSSLNVAVKAAQPDEVYNLAAQSFVGASFSQPVLTGEVTGLGTLRMLEAVHAHAPQARFYQASSSEMFGHVDREPQDETTPFHPRSPYGVAKVYAYWACINYREAYSMFISNGILFNHESLAGESPIIVRDREGFLDCTAIADTLPNPVSTPQSLVDFEVWDRGGFTQASIGTAHWNGPGEDKSVQQVVARSGEVRATAAHQLILKEKRKAKPAATVARGDQLERIALPDPPARTRLTPEFARLLGLMVAEGSTRDESGRFETVFRNNDHALLDTVQTLWEQTSGGSVVDCPGVSGFTGRPTGGLRLKGSRGTRMFFRECMYGKDGRKKVPRLVLNSDAPTWRAFLSGYNQGDGLKAGHGKREFKNFKTNSAPLAAGLWWMASRILPQKLTFNVDFVKRGQGANERLDWYYSINLGTEGGPKSGKHLLRPAEEVKGVRRENYVGWVYDIATQSGTFHAGVGDLVIHNSPRRGFEFVTRRISDGVARIALGKSSTITLGNLDARRDWGYAPDYVDFMWKTLQHQRPDDFVGATGESHTVREFAQAAFEVAGVEHWEKHVKQDDRLLRPSEVFNLRGDPRKSERLLGWQATTRFPDLVRIMVESDLARLKGHGPLRPA